MADKKIPKGLTNLDPWQDFIRKILVPYYSSHFSKEGGMKPGPAYPGQLSAPWSPQWNNARQFMQMRAQSGGPQAWGGAQNFINSYLGGYDRGVFNPFTSGIDPYGGGGGMGMGGPMGGGGGGGGMPPLRDYRQPPMPPWMQGGGGGGR